jgi:hypothetical protein
VEILQQQHRRLALAARLDHALHHRQQLQLTRLRLDPRSRAVRIRHPQKLEQQRKRVLHPAVQEQQGARHLVAHHLGGVPLPDREVAPHQLQHGQEGDHRPVRHAVRFRHPDAPRATARNELVTQAAFPHARLPHHAHHLTSSGDGPLERRLQRRHLVPASHELREAALPRQVQAGAQRPHPPQREDPKRLGAPLDLRGAQVLQLEVARDQRRRVLGQVRRPRLRQLLHPRRQAHGVPLRGVVHAQIVSDLAHHYLARVEADAHREAQPAIDP